jgi:hypothetical protein
MKIFVFSDGIRHGCYIFREEIPLEALERRGHTVVGGLERPTAENNYLADVDLFIIPRFLAGDYPLVADEIRHNGKPIVYEIDDAADLFERYHTSYFQVRNMLPSVYYFLHEADMVTVTTERLAEHFRSLGAKNVVVLPNCPDFRTWVEPRPPSREKVRIGYTGWTAHIMDAATWMEVMAALRQVRQDFIPVLFGVRTTKSKDGPEWMNLCKDAVNANPIPNYDFGQSLLAFRQSWLKVKDYLEWHAMTAIDDYWKTLAKLRLDIGCAMLLDTPFNNCKSCVKFYDYAGAGAVTIASQVLPYIEEPMVHVPNTVDAWVRMLSMYIDSYLARQQRLQEQRVWIRENRDADKWAEIREQMYESLLTPQGVTIQ